MSGFRNPVGAAAQILNRSNEKRPAAKVVTLQPSAFSETWDKRPKSAVQIGIRLVSDEVLDGARSAAAVAAWEVHHQEAPLGRIDLYNETLMRSILAHACVKPDDVRAQWFGGVAESLIAIALTDVGVLALWEAYELLKVETSPLSKEATDAELEVLAIRIADRSVFAGLTERDQRVVRRILRHAIEEADSRRPS